MSEANWLPDALKHAESEYPNESCGFVVNDKYLPRKNIHDTPADGFTISGIGYASAVKKGELQVIVHSHPDGQVRPSLHDLKGQLESNIPWCILPKGKPPVWVGRELATDIEGLLGRPFIYGVNDCYTIIRSAFKIVKGIELGTVPTEFGWWNTGGNVYVENFEKVGFRLLQPGEHLEPFDCILGAVRSKVVNHAALYLGNGVMLHHLAGRISCRESALRWMDALSMKVRYVG